MLPFISLWWPDKQSRAHRLIFDDRILKDLTLPSHIPTKGSSAYG